MEVNKQLRQIAGGNMWLEVTYKPTTLFSLKSSMATNSAGKSIPCPSPYAIKMALLNAIITYEGLDIAKANFSFIRDLEISFLLSDSFVTNNCMIRIMKDNDKVKPEVKEKEPFKKTVAFREYVYLGENLKIAIKLNKDENNKKTAFLQQWFMHINYFGKKGCFFQFTSAELVDVLHEGYAKKLTQNLSAGVMYPMDDVVKDDSTKFENMSNFDKAKAKREQIIYVFPFKQKAANKNYTLYQRIKE